MIGAFLSIIGFALTGLVGITFVPLALLIVLLAVTSSTAVYG